MTRPAVMQNLPWRVAGLVLLGVLVVLYQTDQGNLTNRLLIPIAMALAVWLLVQNALSVALGAGLLAFIHSDGGGDWISAIAYPVLAVLCAAVVAAVFGGRFRRHVEATHEARWRGRRERVGERRGDDDGSP